MGRAQQELGLCRRHHQQQQPGAADSLCEPLGQCLQKQMAYALGGASAPGYPGDLDKLLNTSGPRPLPTGVPYNPPTRVLQGCNDR